MLALSEFVRRQEVLDLIEKMRMASRQPSKFSADYWEGYEDSLLDLLDAFYGGVHPSVQINAVTPCIHGYLECMMCDATGATHPSTRCRTSRLVDDVDWQRCIRPAQHDGPHFFA